METGSEFHDYKINNKIVTLPRHWVPIMDLEEIAKDLGYNPDGNFWEALDTSGIDIQNDKKLADFNGVHVFLFNTMGIVSTPFLRKILDSSFNKEEYYSIVELLDFLYGLSENNFKESVQGDLQTVISALGELVR